MNYSYECEPEINLPSFVVYNANIVYDIRSAKDLILIHDTRLPQKKCANAE